MPHAYIDTDVIIRLLTGDDPPKQSAARALFERVERRTLILAAPDTVIADAVYVLSSKKWYNKPRREVRDLLAPLVKLRDFRVQNKRAVLRALDLYAETKLDFGDVLIIAGMELAGARDLYSYDHALPHLPEMRRHEP